MEFRNEWKSRISRTDFMTLGHRLATIMRPDIYSSMGFYHIHSLIFEDPQEKDGNASISREQYRIRYYNSDFSRILLEKIQYYRGLTTKESCEVTEDFVETILHKSYSDIIRDPMGRTGEDLDPLLQEFYWQLVGNGLRPAYILDHDRRSWNYPYGDVKISIDCNICADHNVSAFLSRDRKRNLIFDDRMVLNIKWKNYLPDLVKSVLSMEDSKAVSYY